VLRAHGFWLYASRWSAALGQPLRADSPVLDIGCGWGRITRTFAKDVAPQYIFGCDIDPGAIQLCQYLGVPGTFVINQPNAELPFGPNTFSVITASSVFSHLPERVAQHLVLDMCRVARPGGLLIFTVEDESFFDYFDIPGIESHGERWRLLSQHKGKIPALRRRYHAGEYIYLVTNEEAVRSSDVYGDAVIPKNWFTTTFSKELDILDFAPASPPVYQAVVVARTR
jgi:SAM-dependent methyltransferase